MIAVTVADDGVLDVLRPESDLFQAFGDLVVDRIIVQRIQNDDAVRRGDGPRRHIFHPDEIEVVEDLHRLGVPRVMCGRTGWRTARLSRSRAAASRPRTCRFSGTERREEHGVIGFRGRLSGGDVRFDTGVLRVDGGDCEGDREARGNSRRGWHNTRQYKADEYFMRIDA